MSLSFDELKKQMTERVRHRPKRKTVAVAKFHKIGRMYEILAGITPRNGTKYFTISDLRAGSPSITQWGERKKMLDVATNKQWALKTTYWDIKKQDKENIPRADKRPRQDTSYYTISEEGRKLKYNIENIMLLFEISINA